MKTLRDEACRNALISRLERLKGDETPAWGKMNLEQMLSHLVQTGDFPFESYVPDQSNVLSRTILKPLVLYLLPIPKEVKVSAELDQQQKGRPPMGLAEDRARVVESIGRIGTMPENQQCLGHPFFGKLSAKQWAVLAHKHIDHHLKQFGV
jgi:hypothetical protein